MAAGDRKDESGCPAKALQSSSFEGSVTKRCVVKVWVGSCISRLSR
jgi:hypothetical protein